MKIVFKCPYFKVVSFNLLLLLSWNSIISYCFYQLKLSISSTKWSPKTCMKGIVLKFQDFKVVSFWSLVLYLISFCRFLNIYVRLRLYIDDTYVCVCDYIVVGINIYTSSFKISPNVAHKIVRNIKMPIILQVLFKIVWMWWPPSGPPCIHHVELSLKLTF